MSKIEMVIEEAKEMPEALLDEVLVIMRALKGRFAEDHVLLTETAFAKDWNLPEEDEAWRDL